MLKNWMWVAILAVIFVASILLSVWVLLPDEAATQAQIFSDGTLVATVDLRIDQSLRIEGKNGVNVVTVRSGKIGVTEADCPDGYCEIRGFCSGGAAIVCLPNRLVIEFVGTQEVDGVAG